MWPQVYDPVGGSLGLSAVVATVPILVLLVLLGIFRVASWISALAGFAAALAVALFAYGMPVSLALSSAAYGAAQGLLPISWIVFTALILYKLTVETGKFEILKNSIGGLTRDQRLQALLIAFAFGAFIEGAAGFGTPVAVAAAMLAGLGFPPFFAAAICLLANTAPVAFGSIGTPLIMLQAVTKLPLASLSANTGRLCAPVSLFIPAYLMLVMGGFGALRAVAPAAIVCGVAFAAVQFFVSNTLGPNLTDILASIGALLALVALMKIWRPKGVAAADVPDHTSRQAVVAWVPYGLLVIFVLVWGWPTSKAVLDKATIVIQWPALHNLVQRVAPITPAPSPYGAIFNLNLLSASGTSCLFAVFASALVLRVSPVKLAVWTGAVAKQLALPILTIVTVVALAFVMNYSGQTATLGLALSATGAGFPFFSPLLGWLGVFLTGSDTSANALFGNLQIVTAGRLGFNPSLMAAANSAGGVMGKMISLSSIAIAVAAAQMPRSEEARLFRFTLKHSVLLASVMGLLTMFYAYVAPGWMR
jgi:L-lactate transport